TAAPSAPNRTPATAEREATAQAGSTAGQVERRAFQIPATVPPAPHPRSAGSTATDDLLEPAPRSSRSRTAHRSSHPNRASDVPHISSRSADYTPTPGPIERLFPHPARGDREQKLVKPMASLAAILRSVRAPTECRGLDRAVPAGPSHRALCRPFSRSTCVISSARAAPGSATTAGRNERVVM